MSKAEQRALEAYPEECGKAFHSAFGTIEFDRNAAERQGYQKGYEQAEKDLALTWEDIKKINDLCMEVATVFASVGRNKVILEPPFYEEVLRRVIEQRGKK